MRSLVFLGRSTPAIDTHFHDGTDSFTRPTGSYWSSTTPPSTPFQAYAVSFSVGGSQLINKTSAINVFARAVRGPVTAESVLTSSISPVANAGTINVTAAGVSFGMASVSGNQAAKLALIT